MATFSWLWDSAYEGTPSSSLNRTLLDDHLRNFVKGIRERMEPEHNWGPYVGVDDGSHRGGYVTVCDKGNQAARDALANMQDGALFLMTVGSDLQLQVYIAGTGWVQAGTLDHGALSNLDVNTHTQYLLKAGGTMTGNLDMGTNKIKLATAAESQLGFVQVPHAGYEHTGLGNEAVVKDGDISRTKLLWYSSANYHDAPAISYDVDIAVPENAMILCPNYYLTSASWNLRISKGYLRLYKPYDGGSGKLRFNFRYVKVVTL